MAGADQWQSAHRLLPSILVGESFSQHHTEHRLAVAAVTMTDPLYLT